MGLSPKILVRSPFRFQHGGGERYTLGLALALSKIGEVTLSFDYQYSQLRLTRLAEDFDLTQELDGSNIQLRAASELTMGDFDLSVQIGNSIFPDPRFMARKNIYHCQFPFPQHKIRRLIESIRRDRDPDLYVANSIFSEGHISDEMKAKAIDADLTTIEPFVSLRDRDFARPEGSKTQILSVGRFSNLGHPKRQDLLINALSRLSDFEEVEINFAGGVTSSNDMQYLTDLRRLAESANLNVRFWPNATKERLSLLHSTSEVYWHGTGLGLESPYDRPWQLEHFGIAPLEAMGSGLACFAFHIGGPSTYIEHSKSGYLFTDENNLADLTNNYLQLPEGSKNAISLAARTQSRRYGFNSFSTKWQRVALDLL